MKNLKKNPLIKFTDINYKSLRDKYCSDLFYIRKKVFNDRLQWQVTCVSDLEYDEYDNNNAIYIIGVSDEKIVCSVRLIETRHHNMITGTFFRFFKKISIPKGKFLDASRLFVDKHRVKKSGLDRCPISYFLFLSMINYAINSCYDGMYAIVSRPMFLILKKSGWRVQIISEGRSQTENIYFIFLPLDDISRNLILKKVSDCKLCNASVISLMEQQAGQSEVR